MHRHISRNEILDILDQQIENEYREAVMTGVRAPSDAGGYMVYAPPVSPAAQKTFQSAYAQLNPDLETLMGQVGTQSGDPAAPKVTTSPQPG